MRLYYFSDGSWGPPDPSKDVLGEIYSLPIRETGWRVGDHTGSKPTRNKAMQEVEHEANLKYHISPK